MEPARIKDQQIAKHQHGKVSKGFKKKCSLAQAPRAKFPDALEPLLDVVPNAAVFTAYARFAAMNEDTDSADECEGFALLPKSLYEIFDSTWEELSASAQEKKKIHC